MSFLKDAFERMPKPVLEGRGIKVFRFEELTSSSSFKDFTVMESWGWEDVWEDMLDDHSVQTLVQDVTELMVKGVSLKQIENNLEKFEDRASTHLTTEERVVLLKWLEKHEGKLKGAMPEEEEWGVFATGGYIGGKNSEPYATYSDKKEAQDHAKRLRKQLTKGERGYYRMGYSTRRISEGLSNSQITTLRKDYSTIDKIDPEGDGYKGLIKLLDSLAQEDLKQLADADIKFVSSLARNRLRK